MLRLEAFLAGLKCWILALSEGKHCWHLMMGFPAELGKNRARLCEK